MLPTLTTEALVARYFEVPNGEQQAAVVDELGRRGGSGRRMMGDKITAVRHLIRLLHVTRGKRSRIDIIQALGRASELAFAVPPLLGELDDPDWEVVGEVLLALGQIGLHFGAAAIDDWLEGQDLDVLPQEVLEQALLALCQIGWPEADAAVLAHYQEGRIGPQVAHHALAEAVSMALTDEAVVALKEPELTAAAALHLAVVGHPQLETSIEALVGRVDPETSLLLHQLLEPTRGRGGAERQASDLLLDAIATEHPLRRRRLARRLRTRDSDEIAEAFAEVAELVIEEDGERYPKAQFRLVGAAMSAGIGTLQDQVLERFVGNSRVLKHALERSHTPTPVLDGMIEDGLTSKDRWVATAAMRARLYVWGAESLESMQHLEHCDNPYLRVEWVRVQQNAWMLRRDTRGRLPLDHAARQGLVRSLRRIVAEMPPPMEQELALYVTGNLGLRELEDAVLVAVVDREDARLRKAAATALGELGSKRMGVLLSERLSEEGDAEVRVQLLRAALGALGDSPPAGLGEAVLAVQAGAVEHERLAAIHLLGAARVNPALDLLKEAAGGDRQADACAAITALGNLGSPRGLGSLLDASAHRDDERRARAATAMGKLGGEVAIDRLVNLVVDAEEDGDVREAAMAALEGLTENTTAIEQLVPAGPDDPLALRIVQRRMGALQGVRERSTDDIDRSLEAAVDGFVPDRLARLSLDSLGVLLGRPWSLLGFS